MDISIAVIEKHFHMFSIKPRAAQGDKIRHQAILTSTSGSYFVLEIRILNPYRELSFFARSACGSESRSGLDSAEEGSVQKRMNRMEKTPI